ncbi:MAG: 2-C-methyl-D-erythritol 4-phosphate cytidylyltransferase [Betaproteobacteria bacterium]|nr:2-C-methyl-D-erythritol 4-phosphate cytidylyltransferase [Betaproteobacteria bacterium]
MSESSTYTTRIFILVPCGGNGSRAGAGGPKQYRSIAGKALVSHTLDALVQVPGLAGVLVVVSPDDVFFRCNQTLLFLYREMQGQRAVIRYLMA